MELRTSVVIAMAHRLKDFDGPCRNLHGHNWTVTALLGADETDLGKTGFVVEFGYLRKVLKDALDFFDHSTILQEGDDIVHCLRHNGSTVHVINEPPTTEHIAGLFFEVLAETVHANFGRDVILNNIELHETPNNCVFAYSSTGVKLL